MPDTAPRTVLIEYAGEHISVSVSFMQRERLSISVHPDGAVTALAPVNRSLDDLLLALNRRRVWIARQRRYFEQYQPLPLERRYITGETHLYLGRQYRLRLHQACDTSVRLLGRYFDVNVPTPKQPQTIADAMQAWYQSHAEALFRQRVQKCLTNATPLKLGMEPSLRVRPMVRRWGSCSKAGTITLNTNLVKVPLHCIDYVIMHELCHLQIHNHSPAFFRVLGRCMPDWQKRKDRLESMGHSQL